RCLVDLASRPLDSLGLSLARLGCPTRLWLLVSGHRILCLPWLAQPLSFHSYSLELSLRLSLVPPFFRPWLCGHRPAPRPLRCRSLLPAEAAQQPGANRLASG